MDLKAKRRVILEIQGTNSDFMLLILFLHDQTVELVGVTVTAGACFMPDGLAATFAILKMFGRAGVPVARSRYFGRNSYPLGVKANPKRVSALAPLVVYDTRDCHPIDLYADELIAKKAKEAPLDLVVAGPVANAAVALADPDVSARVQRLIVVGGTLADRGDVVQHNANGKAEYRFYWEPESVSRLLSLNRELELLPLELSRAFAKFADLDKRLAPLRRSPLCDLLGKMAAQDVVAHREDLSPVLRELSAYLLWRHPELYQRNKERVDVKTEVPAEGQLVRSADGSPVCVVDITADKAEAAFHKLVEQLQAEFAAVEFNTTIELPVSEMPAAKAVKVFVDQDGAVDDMFGLMMLLNMPNLHVVGVGVVGADCVLEDGLELTLKLLALYGRKDVQVSACGLYIKNQFPIEWRTAGRVMRSCPQIVNQAFDKAALSALPTHLLMIDVLEKATEPIKFFISGPMTNLARALEMRPDLARRISEVVVMGGAVFVGGNVDQYGHDGSAEWNVYTDAQAYASVLRHQLRLVMIALDATNYVPLSYELLRSFAQQANYSASDLLSFFLSLTTTNIPSDIYTYFLWDTLAACFLGEVNFCDLEPVEIEVLTAPPSEGRTKPAKGSGHFVQLAKNVRVDQVYPYLLHLFRYNLKFSDL